MKLGESIYSLRKKQGLSQERLAEEINVTRQTISNWELGDTSPNPEQLKLLSKTLNISVDELIGNDEYVRKNRDNNNLDGYEYISKIKIKGIPLVHINIGRNRIKKAKGIIAIGNIAKGIIAIGGIALGIFSIGGLSLGAISLGGLAIGLLMSLGGLSVGSIAIGGIAIGIFSMGGVSLGIYAIGGVATAKNVALGDYAQGHIAIGNHIKGVVELKRSDVTSAEISNTILSHFPNTWDKIVKIISNVPIEMLE